VLFPLLLRPLPHQGLCGGLESDVFGLDGDDLARFHVFDDSVRPARVVRDKSVQESIAPGYVFRV